MSTHEFADGMMVVIAAMAVVAGLEAIVPLVARDARLPGRRSANLALTVTTLLFNWGLAGVAGVVALALPLQGPGLTARSGMSPAVQLVVGIALLDFCFGYVAHRAMHMSPLLWRVHRVHHVDPFVDVTTAYRTHPLEVVWRFLFLIVPIAVLGIPASAVVTYRVLSAINGLLEHANLRVWQPLDGLVSLVWVTPNMHKIHHSRVAAETDTNYGNLFSIADRLLDTFTPSARATSVRYGLDDEDAVPVESFSRLLALPFAAAAGSAPASRPWTGAGSATV